MNVEKAFAVDGPLAAAIPGFSPRPQQVEMAEHIAATLKDNGVLVAEAGTGTGKTYAYLVPALLAGGAAQAQCAPGRGAGSGTAPDPR